jgi:phage gp36-like protein
MSFEDSIKFKKALNDISALIDAFLNTKSNISQNICLIL